MLIVDDNDDAAEMLGMLVEAMGYEAVIEGRPADALKRIDVERPDICLLDVGMPELDGYELARAIRMHPIWRRLTLVAVTGYGQPEDRDRAIQAGFDDHFAKPLDQVALAQLLAEHARWKRTSE
ncbi:response regulator [Lysobacter korlensis]|uniref:Response regulator n=1 Tax=Lysobacter korlensis TaxID=553636 RepID=A0ABV6RT47_9GAMM